MLSQLLADARRIKVDVLVLGGGAAGIRAAVAASERGARVLLAAKGRIGRSGSTFTTFANGWGVQAAVVAQDVQHHRDEILEASQGTCLPELAQVLAEQAPAALDEVVGWGLALTSTNGVPDRRTGCFSRRPRAVSAHNMANIRATFVSKLRASPVETLEHTMGICVVREAPDGPVCGAVLLGPDGVLFVRALAVVIAVGGGGSCFGHNLNSSELSGDGYVLGYDSGAVLANLEFMQFIYTTLSPSRMAFPEMLWAFLPPVTNGRGEPFLDQHPEVTAERILERSKHGPFSVSDGTHIFDVLLAQEALERGGPHGGVFVDLRRLPREDPVVRWAEGWFGAKRFPAWDGPFEIDLSVHALNGGILIGPDASSSVPGLFAAGESSTGAHGADRLGGNMIANCLVFGKLAGVNAARFAREAAQESKGRGGGGDWSLFREAACGALGAVMPKAAVGRPGPAGRARRTPQELTRLSQAVMRRYVHIARDAQGLEKAAVLLRDLEEETRAEGLAGLTADEGAPRAAGAAVSTGAALLPGALMEGISALNRVRAGRLIAAAALARRESRGSHYRTDFPQRDPAFAQLLTVKSDGAGGGPVLTWARPGAGVASRRG